MIDLVFTGYLVQSMGHASLSLNKSFLTALHAVPFFY